MIVLAVKILKFIDSILRIKYTSIRFRKPLRYLRGFLF